MLKIDTNNKLIVQSIDEKWANVTCMECGKIEQMRRTEIRKLNRNNVPVKCICRLTKKDGE